MKGYFPHILNILCNSSDLKKPCFLMLYHNTTHQYNINSFTDLLSASPPGLSQNTIKNQTKQLVTVAYFKISAHTHCLDDYGKPQKTTLKTAVS